MSWAVEAPSTPALTDAKSTFPKVANIIMIAIEAEVTDRLTKKALLAAVAYAGLWFQKPMSR